MRRLDIFRQAACFSLDSVLPYAKQMENASTTPTSEITTATFKVPRDLLERFRSIAKQHERSLSQELRKVMADHVANDGETPERVV
jgi:hypothetical protein